MEGTIAARRAEIAVKLARVRALLDRQDLDGAVFTTHYNYSWLTAGGRNYVASCFDAGATALLVTREACFAFCSVIEEPRIRAEEQLEELGFSLACFGWERDETLALLAQRADPARLIADRPLGEIPSREDLLAPLRYDLTEGEQARYRWLGHHLSEALEGYLLTVRPGMTEYEIAGGISQALWRQGIDPVMLLVTADERTARLRHGLPTGKPLKKSLIVSANGRYQGLITTVSRMVSIGTPHPEVEARYRACLAVESAGMEAMRPGAAGSEVCRQIQASYTAQGWPEMFARHGQGGCQGYLPREHMFTADTDRTAGPDRAYCFNPVIDGAKTEDAFLLGQDGLTLLTYPVHFETVPMTVQGRVLLRPVIAVL